ncbi:pyridoxamine 5'-phosphate oxidase family protein [Luedemannella flava]
MAQTMTDAQWRAFVSEGTRTGKLATAGPPHVVPVWFVLDGDDVLFTTGRSPRRAAGWPATTGPRCVSTTSTRRSRSSCCAGGPRSAGTSPRCGTGRPGSASATWVRGR